MKTSALDEVHDLRVASRRFRAALELMSSSTPKGAGTELRKRVRKLTRKLGELRNIDEALSFFQSHTAMDADLGALLCSPLSELRRAELRRIGKVLKAFDHHHLDRVARNVVAGLDEKGITGGNYSSLPAYFSEVSSRLYLPIQQLLTV
jgi:CHAD domain-containing protein